MKKENYIDSQIPLTRDEILEEIIENNYYMVESFRRNDKEGIVKRHLAVQNLIDTYLNRTKNEL